MTLDPSQLLVVNAQTGYNLVLAPPGCGKTQILAERIARARQLGVEFSDMLCLTFTNRAARGMRDRIRQRISDDGVDRLYVGNIHRYCARFLFENALVAESTALIDEEDQISIIAALMGEDELKARASYKIRKPYFDAIHLEAMVHQIEQRHQRDLRLHTNCLSADDVQAMRTICRKKNHDFTPEAMIDIFNHADHYRSDFHIYSAAELEAIRPMLRKMELAHDYRKYKKHHQLLDFSDLLLLAYDALSAPDADRFKHFRWIQVDEVQDLTPLQMRIVDLLTDSSVTPSVMYLGDEQQAIFSFMGAKLSTIQMLKERCGSQIFALGVNHRSPDYLLSLFNAYAEKILHIDRQLLPVAARKEQHLGNVLRIFESPTIDVEMGDAVQQAQRLYHENPHETVAILVTSNADADKFSEKMHRQFNLPHFKISGTDLFSTPEMRLLVAHIEILASEHNSLAWARLLKGLRVYEQSAAARSFVRQLRDNAMLPSDLLRDDNRTYLLDFLSAYESSEIVVFDTETTGLCVYADDIVQLAAVKIRNGKMLEGSAFKVFISTNRPIPKMLGSLPNPILEELANATEILSPREALQRFLEYAEGAVLVGHNADFDYHILHHNLARYIPEADFQSLFPHYFDTLKLSRLLHPELRQYKLRNLLDVLHLEGENSHLADADVDATKNLLFHLHSLALSFAQRQTALLASPTLRDRAATLRRNYLPVYRSALSRLWTPCGEPSEPGLSPLAQELASFYSYLLEERFIAPLQNIEYVFPYIDSEILPTDETPLLSLQEQVAAHAIDLATMKESDLCGCSFLKERVFVSTVHKAKGLEFDNVIIFNAVDGRYPGFFNQTPISFTEDARKFYVALTRARKRLYLTTSEFTYTRNNQPQRQELTPFLAPFLSRFQITTSLDEEHNPEKELAPDEGTSPA